MTLRIRPIRDADRAEVTAAPSERWAVPMMVTRGVTHDLQTLPGFAAREGQRITGVLTYAPGGIAAEVISLDVLLPNQGIGSALLASLAELAQVHGWRRLWLVTSNDNTDAMKFYQRRGWDIVAFHRDAITQARLAKPEIPLVSANGIAVRHEIELELPL